MLFSQHEMIGTTYHCFWKTCIFRCPFSDMSVKKRLLSLQSCHGGLLFIIAHKSFSEMRLGCEDNRGSRLLPAHLGHFVMRLPLSLALPQMLFGWHNKWPFYCRFLPPSICAWGDHGWSCPLCGAVWWCRGDGTHEVLHRISPECIIDM